MQAEKRQNKEKLEAFAQRLGVLAGRKRLRQVEIARRLDTAQNPVSAQRVGSWFQGRNFPGGDVEFALAALLGVTRDWLIDGQETKETTESHVPEASASPDESIEGASEELENELRARFDELLQSAKRNPVRLGWISEQMREHLAIPKNWRSNEELTRLAYSEVEKRRESHEREERARHLPKPHTAKSA